MRAYDVPMLQGQAAKPASPRDRTALAASLHQVPGAQPADLSLLADIIFDRLIKLTEGNDGTGATTPPSAGG